jgi:hypothetical protein
MNPKETRPTRANRPRNERDYRGDRPGVPPSVPPARPKIVRLERDVRVLQRIDAALHQSSSPRMLRANLQYFWKRYVVDSDAAENVRRVFEPLA